MTILDTVNRLLGRAKAPASAVPETTIQEMPRPPRMMPANPFRSEQDRSAVIRECREMYRTDTRVKAITNAVARDVVKGGFTVKVPSSPKAEEVARALVKRLQLASRMDDWVRLAFRDGDSFLEMGVDGAGQIALVTRKPTLQMRRNTDENDLFPDPAKAFWWADESWMGAALEPPQDAVWFAQWQIVHARWDHDEGSRYGLPMFATATKSYRRMAEGELDMAVRRKTRSGRKFVHVVEGASEPELEAYKERNKEALDDPFAAIADFFTNKPGTIQAIDGDARLAEYDDVMHHVRTFWLASPIAMSLLGYGQDLNRDVLEEQKEQYDQAVEQITEWVETDIVVPILELQWLLAGIFPEGLDYQIAWKSKRPMSATDLRDAADAAIKLKALGLPDEMVWSLLARFVPGLDEMQAAPGSAEAGSSREASAQAIAALAARRSS